jgi:hypothetical protein
MFPGEIVRRGPDDLSIVERRQIGDGDGGCRNFRVMAPPEMGWEIRGGPLRLAKDKSCSSPSGVSTVVPPRPLRK